MQAKKFTLLRHFDGEPKESDFALEMEDVSAPKENQFVCQAIFLSVDPYMRPYSRNLTPPLTMIGAQVARVVLSQSAEFPVDCLVVGAFGWRTHTLVDAAEMQRAVFGVRRLPDMGALPLSYALGACGMPGNTAYFGLTELCHPRSGETLVVTGAAGAVGSLVGQIGKLLGCRVVGVAGSDGKCEWLQRELNFDATINYKECQGGDIGKQLRAAAPDGVDCYFDNVGGVVSEQVRREMNEFGRVAVCGSISQYNDRQTENVVPAPELNVVMKQLKIEGFLVMRWDNEETWNKGIGQMVKWISEGKIQVKETVTEGFDNMAKCFIGMLNGQNTGKAVVKV